MQSNDQFGSSRRDFLRKTFAATIVSTLAPATLLGEIFPRLRFESGVAVGLYTVKLSDFPALAQVNGSVYVRIQGMPASFPRLIVTRTSADTFAAVTEKCSHQGYRVKLLDAVSGKLVCSAHGSEYTPEGRLLKGPSTADLERYQTFFDGGDSLEIEVPGLAAVAEEDRSVGGSSLAPIVVEPGSTMAVIEYTIASAASVLVAIYSIEGRQAIKVIDAHREPGTYRVPCSIGSLPAGTYLCELRTSDGAAHTRKILIGR